MNDGGGDGGEILMGLWDCSSCGSAGQRGDAYQCSSCGASRPENVRFYLPDQAEVIRDEAGKKAALAGGDWQCAYCDNWNPATDRKCASCGAGMDESSQRKSASLVKPAPTAPIPVAQAARPVAKSVASGKAPTAAVKGGMGVVGVMGALMAFLCLCCPLSVWLGSDSAPGTVVGGRWQLTIQAEEFKTCQEEGWETPPDARDIRSEERVYKYDEVLDRVIQKTRREEYQVQTGERSESYVEKVQTGTRDVPDGYDTIDLGNGRFKRVQRTKKEAVYKEVTRTRQVPVYETRVREVPYEEKIYKKVPITRPFHKYTVDRWVALAPLDVTGEGPPKAPMLDGEALEGGAPRLGAKRKISSSGRYWIMIKDSKKGKSREFPVSEVEYGQFSVGTAVEVEFIFGDIQGFRRPGERDWRRLPKSSKSSSSSSR